MTPTTVINSVFGKFNVSIEPKKSITIVTEGHSTSFKIGDIAEYDSYNLSYLGEIVSISANTVTIRPRFETKTRRLKIYNFAWRNYKFNLEETMRQNEATSYSI